MGIRAKQHNYMSRRAKFGVAVGIGNTQKDSTATAEKVLSEQRIADDARRDEWLRQDMLNYYAGEKQLGNRVAAGASHQRADPDLEDMISPPSSPSATLINKASRTDMRHVSSPSTYKYTPGNLTGDYLHEHEYECPLTREMTLKEKIRTQREKVLREMAADSQVSLGSAEGGG